MNEFDLECELYRNLHKDLYGFVPREYPQTESALDRAIADVRVQLELQYEQEADDLDPESWKKYAHMGGA